MKQNKKSIISQWLFWTPLRFAITSFLLVIFATLLSLAIGFFTRTTTPSIFALIILVPSVLAYSLIHSFKKLPAIKMNQYNYISLYNMGLVISFALFFGITLLSMTKPFELLLQNTVTIPAITLFLLMTFILYLLGLLAVNVYVSYIRARELGIAKWKILCSIPFGFSLLSVAGYLLTDTKKQKATHITKSNWYTKTMNWITASGTNTVSTFIFIMLLTGFIMGAETVLWPLTFALVFGIWTLKVGKTNMSKNLGGGYASLSVIINIAFIITFIALMVSVAQQTTILA